MSLTHYDHTDKESIREISHDVDDLGSSSTSTENNDNMDRRSSTTSSVFRSQCEKLQLYHNLSDESEQSITDTSDDPPPEVMPPGKLEPAVKANPEVGEEWLTKVSPGYALFQQKKRMAAEISHGITVKAPAALEAVTSDVSVQEPPIEVGQDEDVGMTSARSAPHTPEAEESSVRSTRSVSYRMRFSGLMGDGSGKGSETEKMKAEGDGGVVTGAGNAIGDVLDVLKSKSSLTKGMEINTEISNDNADAEEPETPTSGTNNPSPLHARLNRRIHARSAYHKRKQISAAISSPPVITTKDSTTSHCDPVPTTITSPTPTQNTDTGSRYSAFLRRKTSSVYTRPLSTTVGHLDPEDVSPLSATSSVFSMADSERRRRVLQVPSDDKSLSKMETGADQVANNAGPPFSTFSSKLSRIPLARGRHITTASIDEDGAASVSTYTSKLSSRTPLARARLTPAASQDEEDGTSLGSVVSRTSLNSRVCENTSPGKPASPSVSLSFSSTKFSSPLENARSFRRSLAQRKGARDADSVVSPRPVEVRESGGVTVSSTTVRTTRSRTAIMTGDKREPLSPRTLTSPNGTVNGELTWREKIEKRNKTRSRYLSCASPTL